MTPDSVSFPDGLYDLLVNTAAAPDLETLVRGGKATLEPLPAELRRARLIEALAAALPDCLDEALASVPEEGREQAELSLLTHLLGGLRQSQELPWTDPLQRLRSVHRRAQPHEPPVLPLGKPWLFTAARHQPALLSELRRELASADQVDILVSFITWSGVQKIADILQRCSAIGADGKPRTRLRILTTTYTGATEARAIQELALLPGAEVRISLDGRRSRLHAKAWILHRRSGYGTAFVGSANLSKAALVGGTEWTVRFTQVQQGELFESAKAHFETLWHDPEFQAYDPRCPAHATELAKALKCERFGMPGTPGLATWFDIQPRPYQQDMLDRLASERRHQRTRNLLVAATGTGKTVVAAFDYRRTADQEGGLPRLLFVAHRKEILVQAMATYRQVLRRTDFGELLADGSTPESFDHVFATLQSLASRDVLAQFGVDYWHTVVIDECHHLAAASFDAFARAIQPAHLLGLTATPERADGQSIAPYFQMRLDGSPAVELRLWEALDQELLAPFEYFGITDETDFTPVRWEQGDGAADLDGLLTGNHLRATRILHAYQTHTTAGHGHRTLGFCVSIAHAEFMAEQFRQAGYRALAVTGNTDPTQRAAVPGLLAQRQVDVVFTCDLYNEGVDLPDVDTLLLLRPTQSPVLFQQQIGRGLRLVKDKTCLILDFIGQHREAYRFDRLLQGLTGHTRRRLIQEAETGFPTLPPGCHIQLERVARDRVLASLKQTAQQSWRRLTGELRAFASLPAHRNPSMADFLREQELQVEDLYRATEPSGWMGLRRAAQLTTPAEGPRDAYLGKRFGDLLHADDPAYLALWQKVAEPRCMYTDLDSHELKLAQMLAYQVFPDPKDTFGVDQLLHRLHEHPAMAEELKTLGAWLEAASDLDPKPLPYAPSSWPLKLHAAYQLREILAAVGQSDANRRPAFREGVLLLKEPRIECLFVTLDKREGYHAGIAYHDYAISPSRFHWQTQNAAGPDTTAGRRYLESHQNGWTFQLFVRETKQDAYRALGPLSLQEAEGNRPMSLTWELTCPLPMALFQRYSVLRAQ